MLLTEGEAIVEILKMHKELGRLASFLRVPESLAVDTAMKIINEAEAIIEREKEKELEKK